RPFNARFSPDGNYITFNWNNIDDDRRNHLWINSLNGGEADVLIENFRSSYFWSEDSKSIYFVRGRDLQKMEVSSKEIVRVSDTKSISQVFTAAPDRKKIVYSKRDGIWMYDLDKNAEKHLSLQNGGRITWSPDSRYICYVYENELKYLDTETGYNWTITSINKRDMTEAFYYYNDFQILSWSPDSKYLAFTYLLPTNEERKVTVPTYNGKYVVAQPARNDFAGDPAPEVTVGITDVESNKTTYIEHGYGDSKRCYYLLISWSPDSENLLIDKVAEDFHTRNLFLAEPGKSDCSVVFEEHKDTWVDVYNQQSQFSNDSKYVLFTSQKGGYNHLYRLNHKNGDIKQLTSGSWELNSRVSPAAGPVFRLTPDSKYVIFSSTEVSPAERHLYRLNIENGEYDKLKTQNGFNTNFILSDDGKTVLYEHSDYNTPHDYYIIESKPSANPVRITDSLTEKFKSVDWIMPEYVTYRNTEDDTPVNAWMFLPPDFDSSKKYPVVIFLHGGILLQNVTRDWVPYSNEHKFHHKMAQRGYIVFDPDIRGSTGYGNKFRTDIYKKPGHGKDMSDLISGVEYLNALGCVDPDRIGVYGGSGGGFMTLMALCLKGEYFACGVSLRCLSDWKNYHSAFVHPILGKPQDNPEEYKESSPITHAEKLTKPLLLMHGLVDNNSYAQESIKFAERLIQAGIDFEFMLYPSQNHGFTDPESWIDEYRRIERFMDKHLMDKKY
ncbi:MAG: prolyl oligopeptidase family serine peptidase, partial [bacterium]|nr:prolyl oligopeptidase family serine peptidase [bacterium]